MSDDDRGGFAPPAYQPDQAALALKRALRDLKLSERGPRFERRGLAVAEIGPVEGGKLHVACVKKGLRTPEWERRVLSSSAEQRRWLDELKARLARWSDED